MKKIIFTITCLIAILMVMSCASTGGNRTTDQERRVDGRIPAEVRDVIRNSPENVLVGVGTARMATLGQSRTISATRARAEISRQIETIIMDMVRDYVAGSEIDHSSVVAFQENITVALSRSRLQGATIVDEIEDVRGNYWTIVMMNRSSTGSEANQAVAAARLAVPAMASFNAEARMNEAFDRHVGTNQVGFSDRD
jgi:hypothetical protein